jgi:hypothetical protein
MALTRIRPAGSHGVHNSGAIFVEKSWRFGTEQQNKSQGDASDDQYNQEAQGNDERSYRRKPSATSCQQAEGRDTYKPIETEDEQKPGLKREGG